MWRASSSWATAPAALVLLGAVALAGGERGEFSPHVDDAGAIALPDPETVRARWDYLGVFAVQGEDGVAEFHVVYTQPGTIEAYQDTGAFPNGAVLVKEVRTAAQGALTTGQVAWSADAASWFVMVKGRDERFPDDPVWAEGWGWALFLAGDPGTNTATDFRADCRGCHLPARETDWVYTQGYPVLRD